MVDEDVPQDGELAVDRGHLAEGTAEGGAEALEGSGRVELADLELRLSRDEFSLEVFGRRHGSSAPARTSRRRWGNGGTKAGQHRSSREGKRTVFLLAREDATGASVSGGGG